MNRFNQYQQRPPPPPHLNVHSQNLVYLTAVPTSIGGKELKIRITSEFGQVKFVETFEAWLGQRTGNIVIDFSAYEDSEAFMTAVIKGRVDFLDGVRIQHIAIVGPRNFFELVRRNTGIDLFSRDGKPNPDWIRIRQRQNRPTAGAKPYDRLPSRGNPPAGTSSSRIPVVLNALTSRPNPFYFYENSTSEEDEMVGPFPSSSSASIRREPGQKLRTFGGRQ